MRDESLEQAQRLTREITLSLREIERARHFYHQPDTRALKAQAKAAARSLLASITALD